MRAVALAALGGAAVAAAALGAEPAVVVLADGQVLEGEAEVLGDGSVRVALDAGPEREAFEVVLAPAAVDRIEPVGSDDDEDLPRALVRLHDGRELRGRVHLGRAEVVVRSALGEVRVPRYEVEEVVRVLPAPPRVALDADLGLTLRIPADWEADAAHGLGERLRLVRGDFRAGVSVVVRWAATAGSPLERAREALAGDLSPAGRVYRDDDATFTIEDVAVDHAPRGGHRLDVGGRAYLRGDLLVWLRTWTSPPIEALVGSGSEDAAGAEEVAGDVARVLRSLRWLPDGIAREGAVFRDPALRLAVEAPPRFRLAPTRREGVVAVARSREQAGASLEVATAEGEPEAALRARFADLEPEVVEVGELRVRRVEGEGVRALAYAVGGGPTVVVTVRSPEPEALALLTRGILLLDPEGLGAEAREATELAPRRAEARDLLARGKEHEVPEILEPVLAAWPDDPAALGMRVAALRGRVPARQLTHELDAAWVATGAPWIAAELSAALLAEAAEEADDPGGYVDASETYLRAAAVWPTEEVWLEVIDFFVDRARAAYADGDETSAWARFARVRGALGSWREIDDVELELRLESARAALKERDPRSARRQTRRAWLLGAGPDVVDAIYADTEALDLALEREAEAERERRKRARHAAGGFRFGIPPTRTSGRRGHGFVQPSSLGRSSGRGRRVRPSSLGRSSGRARRRFRSRSTRRGTRVRRTRRSRRSSRRVRLNGRFVFD